MKKKSVSTKFVIRIAMCFAAVGVIMSIIVAGYAENEVPFKKESVTYPDWTFSMKIRAFDVLYPFETGFARLSNNGKETTDNDIAEKLDSVKKDGANTVIFYIDDEQSYETFVDDEGWKKTLLRIKKVVDEAHNRGLKTICYLNGLEVLTPGALTNKNLPSFGRNYSDWLQKDVSGKEMLFYSTETYGWIPKGAEDAWVSPYSKWRELFASRIRALGETKLDGVYIDATSLPGTEDPADGSVYWASTDKPFAEVFKKYYGKSIPEKRDLNNETWRKFLYFRHETIRSYLGEMASVARKSGMVPFFEMSACDGLSGTHLANDNLFTISGGIACSPEVEPFYLDGGTVEGFRSAKAVRDADLSFPIIYLGWPDDSAEEGWNPSTEAKKEFAMTISLSNNYYPTTSVSSGVGERFAFINEIYDSILKKRIPYFTTILVYPMRSKDFTFNIDDNWSCSAFAEYNKAFKKLSSGKIPFRVVLQDVLSSKDLEKIKTVVLSGAYSVSDEEYDFLSNSGLTLSMIGEGNAAKDKWFNPKKRVFKNKTVSINDIESGLPFGVKAPENSYVEYYTDGSSLTHWFIFVYNDTLSGETQISAREGSTVSVYAPGAMKKEYSGEKIRIKNNNYLFVIDLML